MKQMKDLTDEKLKIKNVRSGTSDIDVFFPQNHFKQISTNKKIICVCVFFLFVFFDSCCNADDILPAFVQTAVRVYFNHFSKDFFIKCGVDRYMKREIFYITLVFIYMNIFFLI